MKSSGVCWAAQCQELPQIIRRLRIVRTGSGGTADARRRQRAFHRRGGVVVQPVVFLGRAFPVADVGFVPNLPIPGLDLAAAVTLDGMEHPLAHQLSPAGVVFRRVGPALTVIGRGPVAGVGLRMDRKRLRHEADFDEGPGAGLHVGVEDAVDDGPIIDRVPGGIFGVGVGRAPFESGGAVAGAEQVVHANIDR